MVECPPNASNVCTLATCSIECASITYRPTLAGNSIYLVIFGVLWIIHTIQGYRYKTWGFLIGMFCGLMLEILGYGGRIMLQRNPFNFSAFLLYLIPLTIGPALLAAGIYLCLSRMVVIGGVHISRLSPRAYAIIFMSFDLLSLVLQATGGGISSTANDMSTVNSGRYIMIAGLAFQVAVLALFMGFWLEFSWRARQISSRDDKFSRLRSLKSFKHFKIALWIATILIFIRSIYRVIELQGGYQGTLASDEPSFMVLEGPMIFIAVSLLAIWHPGRCFGDDWHTAAWSLSKKQVGDAEIGHGGHHMTPLEKSAVSRRESEKSFPTVL